MPARPPSPFLARPESDWLAANALAFAIPDAFPVSPGHTLVIPKRLVATWFDATPEEQAAILALATEVKTLLDQRTPRPDGYNLGLNAGAAAGQTVFHLHLHVIPRYEGDVPDPRGGVRHVIPGKGNYLLDAASGATAFVQGGAGDPLKSRLAPLWPLATDVSIIAAFVQASGLEQLEDPLLALLEDKTKRVRLLTGDYLGITQRAALEQLLDWSALHPNLHARLVETATLPASGRSFHPKSWRFESPGLAVAFVGSSNVSSSALGSGVEWNLQLTRATDPSAYAALVAAFDGWWHRARPLTAALVAAYVERVATGTAPRDRVEDEPEPLPRAPPAHELQEAALDALATTRAAGRSRSLVVLATGLGKTLVAALDTLALGAGKVPRTLFLAHREELLSQAAATFRTVFRDAGHDLQVGFFAGAADSLDGDLVLASVQKLSLTANLDKLAAARPFDHVIVDEVHHATAASYRKILDRLAPRSLLGLTATPERADGADVLGLFDDHVAYRADLGEGIARDLLVPFAYFGLKDAVDYSPANIPWRNHRFDPERLAAAVETEARMETLLSAWRAHPGSRTLVFCCSIRHALHARDWLRAHGVACEAVHGGPGSFDREDALARLREGRLDALCTVDLFNEGVDVPELDRVVMLRPTESTVLFLQQLGRGLRRAPGKERLTVLDFVGNHRVFLERVRLLLSLRDDAGTGGLRAFLDGGEPELPPGCSVELELEAKELLRQLLPSGAVPAASPAAPGARASGSPPEPRRARRGARFSGEATRPRSGTVCGPRTGVGWRGQPVNGAGSSPLGPKNGPHSGANASTASAALRRSFDWLGKSTTNAVAAGSFRTALSSSVLAWSRAFSNLSKPFAPVTLTAWVLMSNHFALSRFAGVLQKLLRGGGARASLHL